MLKSLRIRNYALIDDLNIDFTSGLNVLTGETGAGKSIILGALSLILGEKSDTDMIRTGSDAAVVEAEFELSSVPPGLKQPLAELALDLSVESGLVIRRKVARSGKGACLVNDLTVSLPILKRLGDSLVDLHGQHEHQSLLNSEQHLLVLDDFAKLHASRQELAGRFQDFRRQEAELERLRAELKTRREHQDFTTAQLRELQAARLTPDEPERLRGEQELLETVEKRQSLIQELAAILVEQEGSAQEHLSAAARRLEALAQLDPRLARAEADLKQAAALIDEVGRETVRYRETIEHAPGRLDEVNERLFLIERLARKHCPGSAQADRSGVEALIAEQDRLARELEGLETDETRLPRLEQEQAAARTELTRIARHLSHARQKAKDEFETSLNRQFPALGLASARVLVQMELIEDPDGLYVQAGRNYRLDASGADHVEFLFAANPGEDPRALRKVVSGGELSRVMLGLKSLLAGQNQVPVMVFDEIDTGIGGRVAEAVGRKLGQLARRQQVICITHLPQIARFAATHFLVSKTTQAGRTVTRLARLEPEDRVQELARMLAGDRITETALTHARELLEPAPGTRAAR